MSNTPELHGILLEAGTNELEVLVFSVRDLHCGVNVAKVREVIASFHTVHVPQAHPAVVGVCNLRGEVIPLIDLHLYFFPGVQSDAPQRSVIVTEFNNMRLGFIVDGVDRIYRLRWEAILPLPEHLASCDTAMTSVCKLDEDNIAMMIDFEKIAFDIQGIAVAAEHVAGAGAGVNRDQRRVLLAEDSPTMRSFMYNTLVEAGFGEVVATDDGAQAWARLQDVIAGKAPPFDVIVSDVEMPQMDGLHLCRRIKESPALRDVPVVVFSSLVSDDNLKKMASVAADASLTKPQLAQLVGVVDRLLLQAAVPA